MTDRASPRTTRQSSFSAHYIALFSFVFHQILHGEYFRTQCTMCLRDGMAVKPRGGQQTQQTPLGALACDASWWVRLFGSWCQLHVLVLNSRMIRLDIMTLYWYFARLASSFQHQYATWRWLINPKRRAYSTIVGDAQRVQLHCDASFHAFCCFLLLMGTTWRQWMRRTTIGILW